MDGMQIMAVFLASFEIFKATKNRLVFSSVAIMYRFLKVLCFHKAFV